jgi:hypothetical protein
MQKCTPLTQLEIAKTTTTLKEGSEYKSGDPSLAYVDFEAENPPLFEDKYDPSALIG